MANNAETIEPIKLQWIKGDKIGNVETVVGTEQEWTIFESGSRISSDLIHEFMMPIASDDTILDFESASSEIAVRTREPRRKGGEGLQPSKVIQKETSPVRILFDKQKNVDKVTLTLSLNITVPKKDIFDIISSSFSNEETVKELHSFIADQISDEDVKKSIQDSIKSLIDKRYK